MPETIRGMATLLRRFRALERGAQGTVLTEAADAGAQEIAQDADRLAPSYVRGGIGTAIETRGGRVAEVAIGWKRSHFFGSFAELGTVNQSAQPHLRPALRTGKRAALRASALVLKRAIDRARRA